MLIWLVCGGVFLRSVCFQVKHEEDVEASRGAGTTTFFNWAQRAHVQNMSFWGNPRPPATDLTSPWTQSEHRWLWQRACTRAWARRCSLCTETASHRCVARTIIPSLSTRFQPTQQPARAWHRRPRRQALTHNGVYKPTTRKAIQREHPRATEAFYLQTWSSHENDGGCVCRDVDAACESWHDHAWYSLSVWTETGPNPQTWRRRRAPRTVTSSSRAPSTGSASAAYTSTVVISVSDVAGSQWERSSSGGSTSSELGRNQLFNGSGSS